MPPGYSDGNRKEDARPSLLREERMIRKKPASERGRLLAARCTGEELHAHTKHSKPQLRDRSQSWHDIHDSIRGVACCHLFRATSRF